MASTPNEDKALLSWMKARPPKVDLRKPKAKELEVLLDTFGEGGWPKATGVLKSFGSSLRALAADKAGGLYVEWTANVRERPVVYFGTEGNVEVAASSFREFLGLLASRDEDGTVLKDAMGDSRRDLVELAWEKSSPPAEPLPSAELPPVDPSLAAELAANDIPVVSNVKQTVASANAKYLWPLIDKLDTIVTGYKSSRMWHDAFKDDPKDLRPYSPKETYTVGELVTYETKGASTGKALVLANPQPNRVLLCSHGVTFVRACGA